MNKYNIQAFFKKYTMEILVKDGIEIITVDVLQDILPF